MIAVTQGKAGETSDKILSRTRENASEATEKSPTERKIINRIDKFLFRLQAQILGALLPEIKAVLQKRESDYLEAVAKTSNKEGTEWKQL